MKSDRDGFVQQTNGADPKSRAARFDADKLNPKKKAKINGVKA